MPTKRRFKCSGCYTFPSNKARPAKRGLEEMLNHTASIADPSAPVNNPSLS
jgi:hypothetical protein